MVGFEEFNLHGLRRKKLEKKMVAWMGGGARVAGFEELSFLGLPDVSSAKKCTLVNINF